MALVTAGFAGYCLVPLFRTLDGLCCKSKFLGPDAAASSLSNVAVRSTGGRQMGISLFQHLTSGTGVAGSCWLDLALLRRCDADDVNRTTDVFGSCKSNPSDIQVGK